MYYYPLGNVSSNLKSLKMEQQPTQNVDFNAFNISLFDNVMQNADKYDENDLVIMIKNYIDIIVDRVLSDDASFIHNFQNIKFVSAYSRAMEGIPINYERRLFVNRLTYEYRIADQRDDNIFNIFKHVSEFVNKDIVAKLTEIPGINPVIANDLAVCRYSSRTERINVQRLNFCMCQYNAEIFNEQNIVWVYERLFDRISELFISTMLEIYSRKEMDSYPNEFSDIYGNISLAVLIILNNMPSQNIRQIILTYIDEYTEFYKRFPTLPRFTLRALSYDYARIVYVVEQMLEEGYNIP